MKPEVLVEHLKNKCLALEAKMKVTNDKGASGLYEVFSNELRETQISIFLLEKALSDIQAYQSKDIIDKLVAKIKEKKPNFALYFKEESIDAALESIVRESIDEVIQEFFKDKLVSVKMNGGAEE